MTNVNIEKRTPVPFQQGYNAFRVYNATNPYSKTSFSAKEWQRGWNKAYWDNLQKIRNGS